MHVLSGTGPGATPGTSASRGRWAALGTLVRARLLVASLALPLGLMLRPDGDGASWRVTAGAMLGLGVLSAIYALGVRMGRALAAQFYLQLTLDLFLITVIAGLTGGVESQFVLFFALVVITGGIIGHLMGGLVAAAGACLGYLILPWVPMILSGDVPTVSGGLPRPGMSIAFLTIVGVLAGLLGQRVHRTRADLERTTRELDRVRVDNEAILRHLTTGVLTVDGQTRVTFMNPAAEHVLGLSGDAALDQRLEEALPERLSGLRDIVLDTLQTRRPRVRVEVNLRTASGVPLPVGTSTNLLVHDAREPGVVAVFQDLTAVREMERRMRRSETLAELGALAAGIAHELRNGLNPISGSVEYLQRELKLEGEGAVLMSLISRESLRLNRFVTDLLSYSKERDLVVAPVNLREHLSDLCDAMRRDPRRHERVRIRFEAGDPETMVSVDADQMRQVWVNLAVNSFQAIDGAGELVVRWKNGREDQVVVEFEDDGPGISAQDLPRVGQPFFTTKEGGTGLGLAIAQRIVERHGGALTLHSTPGRGTTARVVLLRAAGVVAQAA